MPNGSFDRRHDWSSPTRLMTLKEIEGPISMRPAVLTDGGCSAETDFQQNSKKSPGLWSGLLQILHRPGSRTIFLFLRYLLVELISRTAGRPPIAQPTLGILSCNNIYLFTSYISRNHRDLVFLKSPATFFPAPICLQVPLSDLSGKIF